MILLVLLFYALIALWIIIDSRQTRGKATATSRFAAFIWSQTGAWLLAALFVIWWFIRAFIGTFLAIVWTGGGKAIKPTRSDADRAKDWVVFPQQLVAMGLTGRGDFALTP